MIETSFNLIRLLLIKRTARVVHAFMICASLGGLCGCETTRISSSDGRPLPPPPHEATAAPADTEPNRMAFFVSSKPDDTNRNGYPDLINVSVSLFSQKYPLSLLVDDGEFTFTLYPQGKADDAGVKPIGTWHFTGKQVADARNEAQYGPCYFFRLSLLDVNSEKLPFDRADLLCTFTPANNGTPVTSDGVRTIQVGRRMTSASAAP
ncbi:MAG TPA: hypothetical protein VG711_08430 [Phycisphaerales bacterium]|nr:hypothetical protein [Phycisphaerales bacterium]